SRAKQRTTVPQSRRGSQAWSWAPPVPSAMAIQGTNIAASSRDRCPLHAAPSRVTLSGAPLVLYYSAPVEDQAQKLLVRPPGGGPPSPQRRHNGLLAFCGLLRHGW